MSGEKALVPELRFPEFEGEWEKTTLGDLTVSLDSKRVPLKSEDRAKRKGIYPYYGASGIIDYIDDYIFDETLLLLAEDGANIVNRSTPVAFLAHGRFWVNNHAHVYRAKGAPTFLVEAIERMDVARFNTGTTMPKLNAAVCAKIPIVAPTLPEQQKIAAFLDAVSKKITLLTQKREALTDYKRGLMQRLFSGARRFTRPDGSAFPDWEERKLGELGSFTGGGTPDTNVDGFWTGDIAWVSSSDISENNIHAVSITRRITDEAVKESATQITPKGAILIVTRVGIGKCAIAPEDLCTSQDFTNFVPHTGNARFFAYWLHFHKRRLLSLAQGTSIKGVTTVDLKRMLVEFPHPEEQTKIADALSALDARIDAVSAQISQMEAFKKGLLQKMFV